MVTPRSCAKIFVGLIAVVVAFQLGLALGAPWGLIAMGGSHPGALPPTLRLAALAQIGVLTLAALVIVSRAQWALPSWRGAARWSAWVVVGLMGVSVTLNLITPSGWERIIWTPVALGLFLTALRVASSRG